MLTEADRAEGWRVERAATGGWLAHYGGNAVVDRGGAVRAFQTEHDATRAVEAELARHRAPSPPRPALGV